MIRRRAFMTNEQEKNYVGEWLDNHKFNESGRAITAEDWAITPYFKVTPGSRLTFNCGGSIIQYINEYKDDFTYKDYWGSSSTRTITISKQSHYVRLACYKPNIENSYIVDANTGEYIFKGSNVNNF